MRRTIHGCGSSTGSGVRSMRNGWALSNCAAPSYGLVSTAKRSGGRRRHHSHSSDWIPPILGGKSFVTSRCFTPAPRRQPSRALAQRACSARTGSSPWRYRASVGHDPRRRPGRPCCRARRARCAAATAGRGRRCTSARGARAASRRRRRAGRARRPRPRRPSGSGRRWRRPRCTVGGHTSWQSSQPYRRSPTAGAELDRDGARALQHPGQAAVGVDTPGATIAPVGQASRQRRHDPQPSADRLVGRRVRGRRDHAPEHEPAAGARQQQVGVLAEPAEPGPVGDLAVDDRVVVGEGHGPLVRRPAAGGPSPAARRAAVRSGRPRRSGPPGPAGAGPARRGGSASAR